MKQILFLLLITICVGSCKNLVPYTDALKEQREWTEAQMKHLQLYLSEPITMERKMVKGEADEIHGKVITRGGIKYEIIHFRRHTRVAYEKKTGSGSFLIKCEKGNGNILTFGANPNEADRFVLLGSEWANGYGKVHYNKKVYFVQNNDVSHLLVDIRNRLDKDIDYRIGRGVRVR